LNTPEHKHGTPSLLQAAANTDVRLEFPKTSFRTDSPALLLMLLPALLGFGFIAFGVIYAGSLRAVAFEFSWLFFAFTLIGAAISSKAPVVEEIKYLPKAYLVVFFLFACVWAYTTIFVAPSSRQANYASGIGITAILAGLASAALKRRFGNQIIIKLSWALFIAMLLHAPSWIWLYALEGGNPTFDWNHSSPGVPSLRMYSYLVEAGIAAGLGLFFLTGIHDRQKRRILYLGTTILWMLLMWSGGRGGVFALLALLPVASVIVPEFISKMWKFVFSTLALGAGLSMLLPLPSGDFGILRRIANDVNSNSLNDLSTNRLTIWADAYSVFLDRPIFGYGVAQYRHITQNPELVKMEQAHNIVLESLMSFGLVGTVALVFLLGKIWFTAAFRLRSNQSLATLPVFLISTTLLVHGLVSGTYYQIHSVFIIAISLGLLLHVHEKPPSQPIKHPRNET